MEKKEYISTTKLSRQLGMDSDSLFDHLQSINWIEKESPYSSWKLTEEGKKAGGKYHQSQEKNATWIVWPEDIVEKPEIKELREEKIKNSITATQIGEKFDIKPNKINLILAEMGWIKKNPIRGWNITPLGTRNGGEERYVKQSGVPYVIWPENITENKILVKNIKNFISGEDNKEEQQEEDQDFRKKYPAQYRTMDGHYVRSKSEVIIDDWLYINEITHAYERKIPVEENLCCDFFIPKNRVYIEFWGLEDDPAYVKNKQRKLEVYKKYQLNLISLRDSDIKNLDDILPQKLLKFDIASYK